MGLEVEALVGTQGADAGFLDQVLGAAGVAGEAAGDAVERVELLQRQLLKLVARQLQMKPE